MITHSVFFACAKPWNFFIRVFSSYNTIIQDTVQTSPRTLKRSALATSTYLAVTTILEGVPQNYTVCITYNISFTKTIKLYRKMELIVIYMQNKKIQLT